MSTLKETLFVKIKAWRPRTTKLLKEFGHVKLDEVTIEQCIGGMRDIKSLVTDISYLDPQEGIRFRGFLIPELLQKLPKVPGCEMPYVEGLFYLLLTGDVPTEAEVAEIHEEFRKRAAVPTYIWDILAAMPKDSHPMTMFSAAVLSLQKESLFAKAYERACTERLLGHNLRDALNCVAKLPAIAAHIYRLSITAPFIPSDPKLDFGGDFAHMMGVGNLRRRVPPLLHPAQRP